MRNLLTVAVLALLPSLSFAQTKEMVETIDARLGAQRYVLAQEHPGGGFKPYADGTIGLRPTSAAIRAIKYLGGKVPNPQRHAAFVLSCYDPATGGFAEIPGGKPEVFITSVGVMAAVELDIPREKFKKAMTFIYENAKSFEEMRIGAAAVEAWGLKDCPFDLKPWFKAIDLLSASAAVPAGEDPARYAGSMTAMYLRLGGELKMDARIQVRDVLSRGRRGDGGWGKLDAKTSDLESTYRVMRAFVMLKEKPQDIAKLRAFLLKCKNADGGFGVEPGAKSGVPATYYFAIISKWLDALEG